MLTTRSRTLVWVIALCALLAIAHAYTISAEKVRLLILNYGPLYVSYTHTN